MRPLSSSFYIVWKLSVCSAAISHFGLEQSRGRSCPLAWVNRNASTKGRLDEGRKPTVFFFFGPRCFALVYSVCVSGGGCGFNSDRVFPPS